jgi:hypothetical protein
MYRTMVVSMAGLMVALGVVLLIEGIVVRGAVGIVLGLLFVAAGALRIWMLTRRTR